MAIAASDLPAAAAATQEILLRVKRPYTEPPVEFFSAIHSKKTSKRLKRDHKFSEDSAVFAEPQKRTCFRYLGTASRLEQANTSSSCNLEVLGASGERRLVLTPSAKAHVIDPDLPRNKIPCTVQVSTAAAAKRKADFIDEFVAGDSAAASPPPPKSLRVIDLLYRDPSTSDPLAVTLNGLRLSTAKLTPAAISPFVETVADNPSGFVYDVYVKDTVEDEEGVNEYDDIELPLEHSPFTLDNEDDDRRIWDGDSEDSNCESNWRNDYPDEDDEFARSDDGDLDEYGKSDDSDEDGENEFSDNRRAVSDRGGYYF